MTAWTHNEQLIITTASDDLPPAVRGAQRFAAAVEKLDTADQPVDLTAATASNVGKLLEQAITADLGADHRGRHLATLRSIAADRLEAAWRESFLALGERFAAEFDTAASELVEELEKHPTVTAAAIGNPHDARYTRLRDIIARLDAGKRLRACYPSEPLTNKRERDLSRVCILVNGSNSAINFGNRNGHNLDSAELWLALARSEDVQRICWQSAADQQKQPGPAAQRQREQTMRDQFEQREQSMREHAEQRAAMARTAR
jgi:hypothetical protein